MHVTAQFPIDRIYLIEFDIKDTTDTARYALYLGSECQVRTKLYDKGDDFNFPIVNLPFICSNIPTAPAYEEYTIFQLIQYSRTCGSFKGLFSNI